VRKSEIELIGKFRVDNFPTLLVITDPEEHTSDFFMEDFKIDQLNKFLNKYSYSAPKYEKKMEVLELNSKRYRNSGICGKKSSNLCLLLFVDSASSPLVAAVSGLLELYKSDPITFTYVNRNEEKQMWN